MKKILCLPVFAVTMLLAACTGSDKTLVQEAGDKFIAAVIADDFTTFRSMATPETFEQWGTVNYHHYAILGTEKKERLQETYPFVSNVTVNGNEAQAALSTGIPAKDGEITVLHFKKIGRVWFIHEPGLLVVN